MTTSTAEIFGGIGVSIMVFRTEFRIELDRLNKFVDEHIDKPLTKLFAGDLNKLFDSYDLRKSMPSLAELQVISAELQDIIAAIGQAREMTRKCTELLPEFRAWATNVPIYADNRTYSVLSKAADSFDGPGAAIEAGAILPLPTAQQQPVMINPTDAVSNAMLRHRPDLNRGGEGL